MERHDIVTRYAVIEVKFSTKIVSKNLGKDWLHFGIGWEIDHGGKELVTIGTAQLLSPNKIKTPPQTP